MYGKSWLRWPPGLVAFLTVLIAFLGSGAAATGNVSRLVTDASQIGGNLEVELYVAPQAVSPGGLLSLKVVLRNDGQFVSQPELVIFLSNSLSVNFADLPAGTFYNVQTNSISWLPMPLADGSIVELTIPLVVELADIKLPEQSIEVVLKDAGVEKTFTTTFWVGVPATASFSFDPPQAAVGQPIQLIGDVLGPSPITQLWSLGDGRIVEATDPIVIYPSVGVYEVVLQASNPLGSSIANGIINIVPQPIARFEIPATTVSMNESIAFENRSGGQTPLRYLWDFGDGSASREVNPVHHFTNFGTYNVRLLVENEYGTSETFLPVTVGQAPAADFVLDDIAVAGQLIRAQAFFDDSVTRIHWDMGDGHAYEGEFMNHVYWSAGDYQVTVTASNQFSETIVQRQIHVNPGRLRLFMPLVLTGGDSVSVQVPGSSASDTASPDPGSQSDLINVLELPPEMGAAEQLAAYINEARKLNGLKPVELNAVLGAAAQSHADDMAGQGFTGHEGSDGSSPAYRIQRSGYPGGYAGEATAWGMQLAIEPVQYWLASPDHRAILLNPLASDVGVGFSENYNYVNVWYWTAEFASLDLPPVRVAAPPGAVPEIEPTIQLLGPPQNSEFIIDIDPEVNLIFTWTWPDIVQSNQSFGLFINAQGRTFRIGGVQQQQVDNQYQFTIPVSNVPVPPGQHSWQVKLEDAVQGTTIDESPFWPITFRTHAEESELPTPAAEPTIEPEPTATPIVIPTP